MLLARPLIFNLPWLLLLLVLRRRLVRLLLARPLIFNLPWLLLLLVRLWGGLRFLRRWLGFSHATVTSGAVTWGPERGWLFLVVKLPLRKQLGGFRLEGSLALWIDLLPPPGNL